MIFSIWVQLEEGSKVFAPAKYYAMTELTLIHGQSYISKIISGLFLKLGVVKYL